MKDIIPKILHLYWDGKCMSWLQVMTVTTFHDLNPDWTIMVHMPITTSKDSEEYIPAYKGANHFPMLERLEYVHIHRWDMEELGLENVPEIPRSDIFRYYILYTLGGIWSDFDVLWLRSIDYLFNSITQHGVITYPKHESEGFVCYYHTTFGHHSIGVLGSLPRNTFFKHLYDTCMSRLGGTDYKHQQFGADLLNELYPNLETLNRDFPNMIGFPYHTFYPYGIFSLKNLYRNTDLKPLNDGVVCLHWFNGHPLSKEYLNKEFRANCSMTKILSLIKTKSI